MKDWILKHKKIYFAVLIGIAFALFMAITVRGCRKLEKAYAANQTFEFKHFSGMITETLPDDKPFYFWALDAGKYGETYYDLFYEFSSIPKAKWWGSKWPLDINWNISSRTFAASSSDLTWTDGSYSVSLKDSTSYYSNFDLYTEEGQLIYPANPYIPAPVINYVYSDSKPYVTCNSVDNLLLCECRTMDIDECFWQFNGTLHNAEAIDDNMLLQVTFEVKVPTRSYLLSLMENIPDKNYSRLLNYGRQFVKPWLQSENYELYTFVHYIRYEDFSALFDDDFEFSYRLTFADILKYLGEVNPNILDEYPTATFEDNFIFTLWLMHVFVDNTTSLVYYDTGADVYYGNPVINYYHYGQLSAVNVVVEADVFNSTEEELIPVIQESLKEGYDDAIKESQDKIDSLEQELSDIEQQIKDLQSVGMGFGGNLAGTDLWSGFNGLVKGLGSITATVGNLASVVGVALGFLPLQIGSIIAFTFVALCVIAIIKAVRG